jgi:hypothetical protein
MPTKTPTWDDVVEENPTWDDVAEDSPSPFFQSVGPTPEITPPRDLLGERQSALGIGGEVAPTTPEQISQAFSEMKDYGVDTLAQGGFGLPRGMAQLGEMGWTASQALNEPILELGPLAVTGRGLQYTPTARARAGMSREIAQEAEKQARPWEELSRETGGSKFAGDITSGAVSALPALAAGPLGLPAVIATAGAQGGLSTLSDAQTFFEQMPEERRKTFLPNPEFWSATSPAALDALQTAAITLVSGKLFGPGIEGATAPVKREAIKSAIGRRAMEAFGEGVEEGTQQFISDYVIARMVHNPDITFDEAFDGAIKAGVAGGVIGAGLGAVRSASVEQNLSPQDRAARALSQQLDNAQKLDLDAINRQLETEFDRREGERRVGVRIPEGEFAQPGVPELAGEALSEAQSPLEVPGRTPAIERLRREIEGAGLEIAQAPQTKPAPGGALPSRERRGPVVAAGEEALADLEARRQIEAEERAREKNLETKDSIEDSPAINANRKADPSSEIRELDALRSSVEPSIGKAQRRELPSVLEGDKSASADAGLQPAGAIESDKPPESRPESGKGVPQKRKAPWQMTKAEALEMAAKTGELRLARNRALNKAFQDKDDPSYRAANEAFNKHRERVISELGIKGQNYNKGLGLDAQQIAERLTPQAAEALHRAQIEKAIKDGKLIPDSVLNDYPSLRKLSPLIDRGSPDASLSLAAEASPNRQSVLEMPPEGYFDLSRQWASDAMAGKGETVQVQAELAALRDPDLEAWQAASDQASKEARAVRDEVRANPASMADVATQRRFSGAAQKAQFFSEGLKVLQGAEPDQRTKAALAKGPSLSAEPSAYELPNPVGIEKVQEVVAKFKQDYPGARPVNVARDHNEMPDSVQQASYSQGGYPWLVNAAVTADGQVWINAANMVSEAQVVEELLHENAGHWATDKQLGKRLNQFMGQVADSFNNHPLMEEVRAAYGRGDKVRHGREFVARIAQAPEAAPSVWKQIVAKFREWLRSIGWVKTVSENDIKVLLNRSLENLRKADEGMSPEEASLSLRTAAEIAAEGYPSETPKTEAKPTVAEGAVPPPRLGGRGAFRAGEGGATPDAELADVYRIFEPNPKNRPSLKERGVQFIEAIRTGVSSKFRPINKLAEDIGKAYGRTSPRNIAGIMEQLNGSQGKAEADIYRFDRDVSRLVQGSEKDFNAYIFLRRSLDRLNQDLADIERAQAGEDVPNLNRRAVSDYTIPQLETKLAALERKIGPEKLSQFQTAAEAYQQHLDKSLRLQVESGRMSQEVYDYIKEGNQFYAPFKVMKYIEDSSRPEGSGRRIDTTADFTKAMEGIESPDFKLGDMLAAARQSILMSRILADKNMAMRHFAELANYDAENRFLKPLKPSDEAPKGMEAVNVLENGKVRRFAVIPEVAQALNIYGGNGANIFTRTLSLASIPFRAGATALNLPFQVSNLVADVPRQALISKYGIRGASDAIRYPLDVIHALYSSISGDVFGKDNKLFLDFLDSGVAGTTIQEYLTPEAFKFKEPTTISKSKKLASSVINLIPEFAKAIEQTSKVLGVKRAMRFEGVTSGKELAKRIPEAITELRRFSGSPDFGRQGKWIEQTRLNLIYMFLNARIQGAVADVGRLAGRDGAKQAARTWFNLTTAVGIPTAILYALNNRDENREDYERRPDDEKRNYWLIPKDTYITNDDGERMRDYWRIPKRESSKWIANLTEAGLEFARRKDPEGVKNFAATMIEELSPVNISGDTFQERGESVAASLNPLLKAPLEMFSGRDFYRHRDIVPPSMKKASPENQFTQRTAEAFKTLAEKMPDVSPEVLRSPLMLENLTKNLTAGLITQFLPRKPVEGRSQLENTPLLARFQAVPYTKNDDERDQIEGLEREAADETLTRFRAAEKLIADNKGKTLAEILSNAPVDEKLMRKVSDLYIADQNGITGSERRVLSLPVRQRAAWVADQLSRYEGTAKQEKFMELARKRILTEAVYQELATEMQQ